MTIVRATVWRHDKDGAPHCESMPITRIRIALQQMARFWAEPYTNLGNWKAIQRNKSHPGSYKRRDLVEVS